MSTKYQPRQRRLNPQIAEFVGILNDHWQDLLVVTDYLERKSRLRVIRQIIDQIIEQPEWLEADLQPGAAGELSCWLESETLDADGLTLLSERPFDSPGSPPGRHFLYTDSGMVSALFEGDPVDPGSISTLLHHGPYVYCLEQRHLTAEETRMRVISGNLWRQLVEDYYQRPPDPAGARFFLLCDPRGVAGGKQALRVLLLGDEDRAIETAEWLSRTLNIRFLVARVHLRYCTR